jgi:hypothetical protein
MHQPVPALPGCGCVYSRPRLQRVEEYLPGETGFFGLIYERLEYKQDNSSAAATNFKSYDRNGVAGSGASGRRFFVQPAISRSRKFQRRS